MLAAIKRILKMCGHAFTATVHERLDTLEQRSAETDNALLQASLRIAERMQEGASHTVAEISPQGPPLAAWVRLIEYLYSYLPSRRAALLGETLVSGRTLAAVLDKTGYETTTCQPEEPILDDLGVLVSGAALELAHLNAARLPAMVVTEAPEALDQLVREMSGRRYFWYLVVNGDAAKDGSAQSVASFYANYAVRVPGATAHVFFFRDRETFVEARSWCAALLRRTYFRHRSP
jgi:hypothetical protein